MFSSWWNYFSGSARADDESSSSTSSASSTTTPAPQDVAADEPSTAQEPTTATLPKDDPVVDTPAPSEPDAAMTTSTLLVPSGGGEKQEDAAPVPSATRSVGVDKILNLEDTKLPILNDGIVAFVGPKDAGKTTLMQRLLFDRTWRLKHGSRNVRVVTSTTSDDQWKEVAGKSNMRTAIDIFNIRNVLVELIELKTNDILNDYVENQHYLLIVDYLNPRSVAGHHVIRDLVQLAHKHNIGLWMAAHSLEVFNECRNEPMDMYVVFGSEDPSTAGSEIHDFFHSVHTAEELEETIKATLSRYEALCIDRDKYFSKMPCLPEVLRAKDVAIVEKDSASAVTTIERDSPRTRAPFNFYADRSRAMITPFNAEFDGDEHIPRTAAEAVLEPFCEETLPLDKGIAFIIGCKYSGKTNLMEYLLLAREWRHHAVRVVMPNKVLTARWISAVDEQFIFKDRKLDDVGVVLDELIKEKKTNEANGITDKRYLLIADDFTLCTTKDQSKLTEWLTIARENGICFWMSVQSVLNLPLETGKRMGLYDACFVLGPLHQDLGRIHTRLLPSFESAAEVKKLFCADKVPRYNALCIDHIGNLSMLMTTQMCHLYPFKGETPPPLPEKRHAPLPTLPLIDVTSKEKIVVIAGPRMCGKTTMAKWLLDQNSHQFDAVYVMNAHDDQWKDHSSVHVSTISWPQYTQQIFENCSETTRRYSNLGAVPPKYLVIYENAELMSPIYAASLIEQARLHGVSLWILTQNAKNVLLRKEDDCGFDVSAAETVDISVLFPQPPRSAAERDISRCFPLILDSAGAVYNKFENSIGANEALCVMHNGDFFKAKAEVLPHDHVFKHGGVTIYSGSMPKRECELDVTVKLE